MLIATKDPDVRIDPDHVQAIDLSPKKLMVQLSSGATHKMTAAGIQDVLKHKTKSQGGF